MTVLDIDIKRAGYPDNKKAIENINFFIDKGKMVGLIGPNGAGKSTTIKVITGIIKDFTGKVEFLGERKSYVYIPEQPAFYEELTLWEHLELAASVHEIKKRVFEQKGKELLEIFNLSKVRDHFPTSFSKGMQQKLMIIIGLLVEPDVYIIDEPFVGLDPLGTQDFIKLLEKERDRGAGILLSTHQLDIAERICDYFVLILNGNLIFQGEFEELKEKSGLKEGNLFDCFCHLAENRS